MRNSKLRILIFALCILNSLGCATSAMRNGVAQARHEIQKASSGLQSADTSAGQAPHFSAGVRLDRADAVLASWQNSYGAETHPIDDNSYNSVLERMHSESDAKNILSAAAGRWYGVLFGTGGAGALLLSLLVKLLQERSRRKEFESAAGDCIVAIESISDENMRREAKERVRKRQTSRTRFNKLVQKPRTSVSG